MKQLYGRPDWTMLGVPYGDGVMVIASSELRQAELRLIIGRPEFTFGAEPFVTAMHDTYELTTTMGSVVIALGADYVEAVARLFTTWTPDPSRKPVPVLPTAPPALPR